MLRQVAALALLALLPVVGCRPWELAQAGPRPMTYVALGASDSVGVGARDPEREGWVPVLFESLPPGSRMLNVGVSGSLVSQALDQQLPVAVGAEPDLVTVWLAVNDFNARVPLACYAAELDRLLAALGQTGAVVLVGNVPDVSYLPAYRGRDQRALRTEVDTWNAAIAAAVSQNGAVLVDIHHGWNALIQQPGYLSADGFHPSTEGYALLAEYFRTTLQASGGLARVRRD